MNRWKVTSVRLENDPSTVPGRWTVEVEHYGRAPMAGEYLVSRSEWDRLDEALRPVITGQASDGEDLTDFQIVQLARKRYRDMAP